MSSDDVFSNGVNRFIEKVQKLIDEKNAEYKYSKNDQKVLCEVGRKWIKIVIARGSVGKSAYAFIANSDFSTKTLGNIKKGDIHRPASWLNPAKHARGSVFLEDFGACAHTMTAFGMGYLT